MYVCMNNVLYFHLIYDKNKIFHTSNINDRVSLYKIYVSNKPISIVHNNK